MFIGYSNAGFGYRLSRLSHCLLVTSTICIPTQEHKKAEKKYFSKMEMSQLYIGPFLCCYGISLCNRDYDYESFLNALLILTNKISESSSSRLTMAQNLIGTLFNVEVSCVIV